VTPELLRSLLPIVFGALAGGLTNTVAVWMLFHPYEPPRVGRFRVPFLHGAIPKNQARLAEAVGRTVGNRLLTEEDLTRILADREFRLAFDRRLARFLETLLERDRGSLREFLPPDVLSESESILDGVADHLLGRLEERLDTEAFAGAVEARTREILQRLADEPVGDLLTPAREAALTAAVEEWLAGAVEREGFRGAVEDYLERGSHALLRSDRTFEEILPLGLAASFERALASYLPVAAHRLGRLLEDPAARARVETALHDLFHRLIRDLRFHQRLVARLVVNEETLDRVLTTVEEEGAERLSEMLRDPDLQRALALGVNEAVVELLRRPVTDILGGADDPNVIEARNALAGWILGIARDPETRAFLVEKLRTGMEKASGGTWGDLLRRIPPERVAEGVVVAARSEAAREIYRDALRRLLLGLLDRPIGRPADWLPQGAPVRIQATLSDPLWEWLQGQIPQVIRTLDVARRVEEKVLGFPMDRLEDLVRRVTDRELRLIVRLGYVLGAVIGTALVVINAFV
jgi:hypothetical protein